MALTPTATVASLRAGTACQCVCVCECLPEVFGSVRRPRPIALASTDVTGLEECEECGGAAAGVSILGPGQEGMGGCGAGSVSAHSSTLLAGCRPDWLERW